MNERGVRFCTPLLFKPMRIFFQPTTDPAFNLAVEEYLLYHTQDDCLMLWQNDKSIIVGKNQNTAAEINRAYVTEHQIPVIRRLTGGGAVFHDLGNLNYTFIRRNARDSFNDFKAFSQPVVDLLCSLGVPATQSGRNDLLADGKKFSGNAQVAHGDSVLHHGTLLFSANMDNLTQALNVHPLKVKSKGVASVRSRVTNLSEYIDLTPKAFADLLLSQIEGELRPLSAEETAQVEAIRADRYDTWEWNYGTRLPYEIRNTAYFPAGLITAEVSVTDNHIGGVRLSGDFFGKKDVSELEEALVGVLYRDEDLKKVLDNLPLNDYIVGATTSDLLSILL